MRVLIANKFWYRRGGLERVMFDELEWLERSGHEVAHFSTSHPMNEPSPWSRFFVPYLELGNDGDLGMAEKVRAVSRMFSNRVAARQFGRLLDAWRPDVVHVHGIHRQLSPSILTEARRRGVPAVQTVHDYHHICPNDVLLYEGTSVCSPRRCGPVNLMAGIRHRCVRGSLAASALSATETAYQNLTGAYSKNLSALVCPSAFMADTMRTSTWNMPTHVVPNAVPVGGLREGPGEGFVYIGRLAQEKGVSIAAEAARRSRVRLTVAGDGPLQDMLRREFPDVVFLGHLNGEGVEALVRKARAVVVPSLWFENAPMSVLETMAAGVPVVASAIGGIPEQITDGVEGLLVEPGSVEALSDAMSRLSSEPGLAERLGAAGRERVKRDFSPERHLERLLEVYQRASS